MSVQPSTARYAAPSRPKEGSRAPLAVEAHDFRPDDLVEIVHVRAALAVHGDERMEVRVQVVLEVRDAADAIAEIERAVGAHLRDERRHDVAILDDRDERLAIAYDHSLDIGRRIGHRDRESVPPVRPVESSLGVEARDGRVGIGLRAGIVLEDVAGHEDGPVRVVRHAPAFLSEDGPGRRLGDGDSLRTERSIGGAVGSHDERRPGRSTACPPA